MRSWLQQNYNGSKEAAIWTDLWTAATAVDYRLAPYGNNMSEINMLLASDDSLKLSLRRLASWVYLRRTGDQQGALHMLAVRPPGAQADVAPSWLIEESTLHSKMEFQRNERVTKTSRGRGKGDGQQGDGAGDQGGGGKDRGRGRGRGRGRT